MKKIFFLSLVLIIFLTSSVSAYSLYLTCPDTIQAGQTLKCSIDTSSNYPAGSSFDLVFYQAQYTATELDRQTVTIQANRATQYKLFDTKGMKGGQYKMEIEFQGTSETSLSDDSISSRLISLTDRSNEITITSPLTQTTDDALYIDGSLLKAGNNGVSIEVRGGETGRLFGPQYIRTTKDSKTGDGMFSQKVTVTQADDYDVHFTDSTGYIGVVTFHVTSPAPTQAPTTIATTTIPKTVRTTITTVPTPTPTKSPLPPGIVIAALGISMLLMMRGSRK